VGYKICLSFGVKGFLIINSQIYNITSETLQDKDIFQKYICQNLQNNYYWSDDWSEKFYIELAKAGFISTSHETAKGLVLLPELQLDYAILDFKNLHISTKVKKLLNKDNYELKINTRFNEVLNRFDTQHKYNWLKDEYVELLKNLHNNNETKENFRIISVELICKDTGDLIAGEVGYIIGKTYTSLSGFSSKEKSYANYGTLQLVLLAKFLEKNDFKFWNLGHPHMTYKQKLGCEIYGRSEFLKRWDEAVGC